MVMIKQKWSGVKGMKAILGTKTSPLVSALSKRVSEWRAEIGLKTRPDVEDLQEAIGDANKEGIKEGFLSYTVAGCEWYFRVLHPNSIVLRKAIGDRLNNKEYSPYGMGFLNQDRLKTTGVTPIINRYVDKRLSEIWDSNASQPSSFLLKNRIDELVREFERPFLASTLQTLGPRRGGYPWLAPWVVATITYQGLKKTHPQRQDQRPRDVSLFLISALSARGRGNVDDSQFHRNRRIIEERFGKIIDEQKGEWGTSITEIFYKDFEHFTLVRRESLEKLMEQNQSIEVAWRWLQNYGLKLLE